LGLAILKPIHARHQVHAKLRLACLQALQRGQDHLHFTRHELFPFSPPACRGFCFGLEVFAPLPWDAPVWKVT
jgi:hypothetical protein